MPPDPRKVKLCELLLAKAARTTFPAEADAFRERAKALMAKHGITEPMLAGRGPDERMVNRVRQAAEAYAYRHGQGYRAATGAGPAVIIVTDANGNTSTLNVTEAEFNIHWDGFGPVRFTVRHG